jgi:hypothetical protein
MKMSFNFNEDQYTEDKKPVRIDVWYDRQTRSWVGQLKDEDDNQVGNAEYAGRKSDLLYSISIWEKDFGLTLDPKLRKKLEG